ncbi:MAG TPA: PTS sugar transporter subunit IIA [Candidatus Salinicoccus stercoripullorum]|uniref:Ascorbate-specific PTS system EIIA component n=1 Tax=Candidatus Salinicoccus stercoripullorum TaxID=2838756 RepID=A0A9D1TZN2_9STAP|nr:PTS sugar transporter subunit IIA [Candidatus Salinicoccus stercoripullorum]
MLKDVLIEENIQVQNEIDSWEAAIETASRPLLESGKIEYGYVEEMIQNVHELGPYIVISPQIAIAHARPDGTVNAVSLSLLKLGSPVNFSERDHEASLIFVLAAVDNEQHLDILRDLAVKLGDQDVVNSLLATTSKKEIYNILS